MVNRSHALFFSDFPLLPLYLRCELGAKVASLLDPQSKLVQFLRFHTAVSADDLVPCVQAALFMWVFLRPGTDMLPSVSSVPLSSWKHRSPSRPGATGSSVPGLPQLLSASAYT